MNDRQYQYWNDYIDTLKDKLGLKDWIISISRDSPENRDSTADFEGVYGRKCATIRLGDNFFSQEPAAMRQTLVHEVLHAHTDPLRMDFHRACDELPKKLRSWSQSQFLIDLEFVVDGLAEAIAQFLPLPHDIPADNIREWDDFHHRWIERQPDAND